MAIALVQTLALGSNGSGTSQATGAAGSTPTVGNYLVAWAWGWAGGGTNTVTAITFSNSGTNNTWTQQAFKNVANDVWCSVGWAKIASTTAGMTVTATRVGTSTISSIMVEAAEFSGVAASSPVDGTATTSTGSANTGMSPGNMTITSGSLVLAAWAADDGAATVHVNGVAATGNTTPAPGTAPTSFTSVGTMYNGGTFEVGQGAYAINPSSPSNPAWSTSPDTAATYVVGQFALLAATSFPGDEEEGIFYQPYVTWQERARERLRKIFLPEPAWSVRMAKQRRGAA